MSKKFYGYAFAGFNKIGGTLGSITSCDVIHIELSEEDAKNRAVRQKSLIATIDKIWDQEGLNGRNHK
jgi:hypothetical protein